MLKKKFNSITLSTLILSIIIISSVSINFSKKGIDRISKISKKI